MSNATRDARDRLAFAGRIAREAGEAILRHYGRTAYETKVEGSPVTAADLEANELIVAAIRRDWPGEAILAEESQDSKERLGADLVWLVDPLDGTREFLARNGEFSTMIGVAIGGEPVLGIVYVPVRGLLYRAVAGDGAWAEENGAVRRLRCVTPPAKGLRMVGSRSHGDATLDGMREALGVVDLRPSGSVGIKCALIAEGECDVYVHPVPYLREWDTCAPEVLLKEAGGAVSDCAGDRLRYNKADPSQPDGIVACPAPIHARVLESIRPLYEAAVARRSGTAGNPGSKW